MKANEIRNLTTTEIEAKINELKDEYSTFVSN